ncbi:uncharacterized protein LOC143415812 [Maylandia zebra]|uniref:uncharacterized protein LOC143415812 n=1 Tax=Maylandia zebra TaxID=106582 RepID=UPI00403CB20D
MCPSLSTGRPILLLSLSVVMLIIVSEGAGHVESSCYHAAEYSKTRKNSHVAPNWTKNIISCFKQDQQGCTPGYLVKTRGGKTFFLKPDTKWLKKKINEKTLQCPPVISKRS